MTKVYVNRIDLDELTDPKPEEVQVDFRFSGANKFVWAIGSALFRAGKYLMRTCIDTSGWAVHDKR